MDRRAVIGVMTTCLLALSGIEAQPVAKIPTIGFIGLPQSAGVLVQEVTPSTVRRAQAVTQQ